MTNEIYTCRHGTLDTPCPECHVHPNEPVNVGGPGGVGGHGTVTLSGPGGFAQSAPSFERQVLSHLTTLHQDLALLNAAVGSNARQMLEASKQIAERDQRIEALERGTSAGVFAPTFTLPSVSGVPGEVLVWTTREGVPVVNAKHYREALAEIERLRARVRPGSPT